MMRYLLLVLLMPVLLWGHDDLEAQIEAVSVEITADPANAALYLRRAELYRLHEDCDSARADIAAASRIDPDLRGLDRMRARVLMDLGDYAGARLAFDRHLALVADDGDALASRAECAQRLGDSATARQDLESALKLLHQPDPDLTCRLAKLLHAAGRTDEALDRLDAAREQYGNVPAFAETALAIERADGRHEAALARIDRLAATGAAARWLVVRGDVLRTLGREMEAIASYQGAADALVAMPVARRNNVVTNALAARISAGLDRENDP